MKKEEKDFNTEMKKMGWREITRAERPNAVINKSLRNSKNRVTMYLDADIIEFYKQLGAQTGEGYQTLINRALSQNIQTENVLPQHVKEGLLKDAEFLQNLKSALSK